MASGEARYAPEVHTDADLARRLVAAQFPRWSDLQLTRVKAPSTDNDMYRLGKSLAVRLPRRATGCTEVIPKSEGG